MATLHIKQSGGANIVSIPKAVISALDLKVGSQLALSVENNKIILSPTDEQR